MPKIDYTFKDSYYNEQDGMSVVTIEYHGNEFVGSARLHPDDAEKASKYAGCRFAEQRAYIKMLKSILADERIKCDACRNFVKSCESYKNWDRKSPLAKDAYRQLNLRIKKVNEIIEEINNAIDDLDKSIRRQEIITNALQTKKSKMDN